MALSKSIIIGIAIITMTLYAINCAHDRHENDDQTRRLRSTRGFKEMELAAARNFGKRAINMRDLNGILMKCIALENRMKEWEMQTGRNLPPFETLSLFTHDGHLPNNLRDE